LNDRAAPWYDLLRFRYRLLHQISYTGKGEMSLNMHQFGGGIFGGYVMYAINHLFIFLDNYFDYFINNKNAKH
jgi:hypothetical protein